MKTLEILKNHTSEIIEKTLDLLPNAFRGDAVNRLFFVKENDGEIIVDFTVNLGQPVSTKSTYFIIKSEVSIDPEEYGYNDLDEVDFKALGWDDKIKESIYMKIEELECNEC